MMYISVLDYSTGNNCVIEDKDDVLLGCPSESMEDFLQNVMGFKLSNISWMISNEEPSNTTTPKEWIEQSEIQSYDEFKKEAKRVIKEYNKDENRFDRC